MKKLLETLDIRNGNITKVITDQSFWFHGDMLRGKADSKIVHPRISVIQCQTVCHLQVSEVSRDFRHKHIKIDKIVL